MLKNGLYMEFCKNRGDLPTLKEIDSCAFLGKFLTFFDGVNWCKKPIMSYFDIGSDEMKELIPQDYSYLVVVYYWNGKRQGKFEFNSCIPKIAWKMNHQYESHDYKKGPPGTFLWKLQKV